MTLTLPGPTIGVVGGGQLGRMLAESAAPLGVDVVVLDPTPDCPASAVATQVEGSFDDPEGVRELAERADVLTFEIELADPDVLDSVREEYGVAIHPSPETLRTIQDKLVQKQTLEDAGVPVPPFRRVDDVEDLKAAVEEFSAVMLKARTGGYDGRGNVPVKSVDEAEDALAELGGAPAMAESFVEFERELSVIAVRGDEELRTFPAGENVHEDEILRETVVPARTTDEVRERAEEVALDVLSLLDGRGVFGIELFESDGEVSVNEIAPRPHNSGHWTIEGALTSQFEQHARSVLGWPLGSTERRGVTVSANILGDVGETREAELRGVERALSTPGAGLHWYGKREVRPLRKMGHVTLVEDAAGERGTTDDLLATARGLTDELTFGNTTETAE
ncbi:5-(carboxyamino)imidazole ribonucleotide synthase [Haloprofundus salilacus]|uniref:5-(carboxyamino)imidazole ribonucleotide synthase n=1 Tax=Haloprofundus salilacus TaxID=2876190 RepID=UPI001CCE4F01|nr:5-(carboxyamino)imidazole ribonucleotide synthase [Haloprofundus salilacus]